MKKQLMLKKMASGVYFYDTWNHEYIFIIGEFLIANVMESPERVINYIQNIGDEFICNSHYAEYKKNGVKIEDLWDENRFINMPYEKFIRMLEKWKIFIDSTDEPDILIITMDDQYNIEFSYEWNGVIKKI